MTWTDFVNAANEGFHMIIFARSRIIPVVVVVLQGAIVGSALGQADTQPSARATGGTNRGASATDPTNPYPAHPSSPSTTNPHFLVHIFTADQARAKIKAKGFSNISGLQKDTDGNWRGKATKNGNPVDVILDFWGDLVAK
jgi:hypothetical protein